MRSPAQVAALCAAFVIALSVITGASAAVFSRTSENRIIGAMNRVRVEHGLRPLRIVERLHAAARAHSADMIRRGYFGHGAFARRMDGYGVQARVVGENLAWGSGVYGTASTIVHEWLVSPEHRANLLRPGFSAVGVGSAIGPFAGRRAVVVTADFAGN